MPIRGLSTTAQSQYAPPPADPADEIEHLAQLHSSGALTDDEFASAKAKVLGSWQLGVSDVRNASNTTGTPSIRQETGNVMSDSRKDVLLKALEAEVGGASVDLSTLFTDDVVGWSPYASVSGLSRLAVLAALREVAFSNVVILLRGIDEVGNRAYAEWLIEADHTGPLILGDGCRTGGNREARQELPGVTVADFREGQDTVVSNVLRRYLAHRADGRRLILALPLTFHVENQPDPLEIEFLEAADPQ